MVYQIQKDNKALQGTIHLDGSKSISNRVLIMQALGQVEFDIQHLSTSNDTRTLQKLLSSWQEDKALDTGAAGTTFRFMTAFLALQAGSQVLTGSERMKKRPIGILVDALRQLGAQIEYLEQENYPPLQIHGFQANGNKHLRISAHISSQFISALLMIAPTLPDGLHLELEGTIVSRPYIEMTLAIMAYFGITHRWVGNSIYIDAQSYQAQDFRVEADWSAASYYYAMAALSPKPNLQLNGLFEKSLQGDAVLSQMMGAFGLQSQFNEQGVHIQRSKAAEAKFDWDFIRCPDIAQSLAVVCAGLGVKGLFTGLDTLSIKETDRIAALQNELAKVGVQFHSIDPPADKVSERDYYALSGQARVADPQFPTYEDHRMAMAFAPLALLGTIQIEDPMVVAKSYPQFWEDIQQLGFVVQELN
ncbi:MAG: 3-phosphoshikimate 1-carboxyvinyltransferase [Bacteroidota bacterium]